MIPSSLKKLKNKKHKLKRKLMKKLKKRLKRRLKIPKLRVLRSQLPLLTKNKRRKRVSLSMLEMLLTTNSRSLRKRRPIQLLLLMQRKNKQQ